MLKLVLGVNPRELLWGSDQLITVSEKVLYFASRKGIYRLVKKWHEIEQKKGNVTSVSTRERVTYRPRAMAVMLRGRGHAMQHDCPVPYPSRSDGSGSVEQAQDTTPSRDLAKAVQT
jgi:hypothetical protein